MTSSYRSLPCRPSLCQFLGEHTGPLSNYNLFPDARSTDESGKALNKKMRLLGSMQARRTQLPASPSTPLAHPLRAPMPSHALPCPSMPSHAPRSPSTSFHAPRSPSPSAHALPCPSMPSHAPRSPSPSFHAPRSPSPSAHALPCPSMPSHAPRSPSPSFHAPRSPSPSACLDAGARARHQVQLELRSRGTPGRARGRLHCEEDCRPRTRH